MLHVDPVPDPRCEQSSSLPLGVYRLTVHPVELLRSSQLSERECVVKC